MWGDTGDAMGSSGPGAAQLRAGDLAKQKHQEQTGRQRQRIFGLVAAPAGKGTVVQAVQPWPIACGSWVFFPKK